jgi:hypothetical protein
MSTPSERPDGQVAREVDAAQHRLGDGCGVDDVVGARDARLDALDVHGSWVRGLVRHRDAA